MLCSFGCVVIDVLVWLWLVMGGVGLFCCVCCLLDLNVALLFICIVGSDFVACFYYVWA